MVDIIERHHQIHKEACVDVEDQTGQWRLSDSSYRLAFNHHYDLQHQKNINWRLCRDVKMTLHYLNFYSHMRCIYLHVAWLSIQEDKRSVAVEFVESLNSQKCDSDSYRAGKNLNCAEDVTKVLGMWSNWRFDLIRDVLNWVGKTVKWQDKVLILIIPLCEYLNTYLH